jgi:hypothetical protein
LRSVIRSSIWDCRRMHRHGQNRPAKYLLVLATLAWVAAVGFAAYGDWLRFTICGVMAFVFTLMFFTNA